LNVILFKFSSSGRSIDEIIGRNKGDGRFSIIQFKIHIGVEEIKREEFF
jgi:hypothetical protein